MHVKIFKSSFKQQNKQKHLIIIKCLKLFFFYTGTLVIATGTGNKHQNNKVEQMSQ